MSTVGPSISVVVPAYQAEKWIAEAVESILAQTRPADEVIVVDDGSTDGTARELERFEGLIRIVRQENRGAPAAVNAGIKASQGDFVALCGADDVWYPRKLEWQAETIDAHPEVDIFFGHAKLTGLIEGDHTRPPAGGVQDPTEFRNVLSKGCVVCAPSVLIRRSLFERIGLFLEGFGSDDYEYWFRCLRVGVNFYYDPRPMLGWRQHESNIHNQRALMDECSYQVLRWYEADFEDRLAAHQAFAPILFRTGRRMVDEDRPAEARRTFLRNLRHARGQSAVTTARTVAWIVILSLPTSTREWVGRVSVTLSRTFDSLLGIRQPTMP